MKLKATLLAAILAPTIGACAAQAGSQPKDIVDTAAAAGQFTTLLAAADAAGLVDTLKGDGPLTVFAPTDAAFAALGLNPDNVGDLPQDVLTSILLYHVAPGARDAADVVSSSRIRTLDGGFLRVSLSGGAAYVNDAQIVATDIRASNGIIHVIDAVLIPAGVGHKRLSSTPGLLVIGGYPAGQRADLMREGAEDRAGIRARIASVPHPESDPVEGGGPPRPWQAGS